jgi:hypothetical protein
MEPEVTMPVETVSVEPTPSPETETAPTPAEPTEPATPAAPELYELPDGRKVDAETLSKEWKDNFYPDYTRKSQTLAEIEKGKINNEPAPSKYADPTYQPSTYQEIIEAAKIEALKEIETRERTRIEEQRAIENTIAAQLTELKQVDPALNENALFLHATKYGFRDLKVAHQNMRDMSELAKKVQATTAQNIAKRADPVSVTPGGTGTRPDPSSFDSAIDYLRSLK